MTLHLYFARKFLTAFLGLFGLFGVMIMLLDMVEQLRRFDDAGISLGGAASLALLSMPQALYQILPLVVILATLVLFLGLARTSEMVVARAAGRSALRALVAPVLAALCIGVTSVAVLNPIVAGTMQRYETRAAEITSGDGQVVSVSREGLWLRQGSETAQTVIRADRANYDGTTLYNVTFLDFALGDERAQAEGGPIRRIDAAVAGLADGLWLLKDAKIWDLEAPNPEASAELAAEFVIPSSLTREQILDSFGAPASVPIWDLPAYIANLSQAGFSARLHRVWFQMELALPLFLAGMVLIGASFTMRHTRFGRTGLMVLFALMLGFGVFFIRNFAQILGENGQIPVALAAWAPPAAAILLSLGLLLHMEDG
ncbi:MAG: LPS export ABC transporter permease LptG [Pseudomonadota bacterium]